TVIDHVEEWPREDRCHIRAGEGAANPARAEEQITRLDADVVIQPNAGRQAGAVAKLRLHVGAAEQDGCARLAQSAGTVDARARGNQGRQVMIPDVPEEVLAAHPESWLVAALLVVLKQLDVLSTRLACERHRRRL